MNPDLHPFRAGTLARRLLLGTLFGMLAALVVAGFVLTQVFEAHMARQYRSGLLLHLNQLAGHLDNDAQGLAVLTRELSDPRFKQPYSGLYWQVDDGAGQPLLRSRSLWDQALKLPAQVAPEAGPLAETETQGPEGHRLLVLARRILPAEHPEQPLRLVVAMDTAELQGPVRQFAGMLALALGLLALGLILVVGLQLRLALGPLELLRRSLVRVREGNTATLQGAYPDEIQPLVEEFNAVLAHNSAVVERARTQAGNLAHALKTPLSILANGAEGREGDLARLVQEQVELARRQVDYHLARARAAAAGQMPGRRVQVRPLLEGLLRVMAKLHGDRGLHLELGPVAEGLMFRGEAQDFQEMLGNLLDNACKWARQQVLVEAVLVDGLLVVRVQDDGPGLSAEAKARVLQRGVREDERIQGSGLGLAIVDDLARIYGGALYLETAEAGGLRVRLELPGALGET